MVSGSDSKASDAAIKNGKKKRLPTEFCEQRAYYAEDGGDDENNDIEPVKLSKKVSPRKRWEGLCRPKSVFNVIVRDVEVGGDIIDF